MSIENSANQTSEASLSASKPKKESDGPKVTTLKLLQNKTHIGPQHPESIKAREDLTKHAGKVMFKGNLKITFKQNDGTETDLADKRSDTSAKPAKRDITLTAGKEDDESLYFMIAWDKLYGSTGSEAYKAKREAFDRAQLATYELMGIPFNPGPGKKPELTEQQRKRYGELMHQYAFSYFEYRLSYKHPNTTSVRTTVYRSLKPMDLETLERRLRGKIKSLKDEGLTIRKKPLG